MEGEITQDDLTCYASDGNKEREKCLEQDKREIPISTLVTVKPSTKSAIRLQVMHVYKKILPMYSDRKKCFHICLQMQYHFLLFFWIKEPIRIFIPHQANGGCRELIVRASIDGGTWKTMDYESGIPPHDQVDLEVQLCFFLIIFSKKKVSNR